MNEAAVRWDEYREHDSAEAREQLILQYAPLVKYVVGRLAISLPPGILDRDDVLSYGTIGLIEAVGRFDPSRGVKFQTFAMTRIRGAIIDGLRILDRLPRTARLKAREVERATTTLIGELGREPTTAEIATHLDVTAQDVRQIVTNVSWVTVSLDEVLTGDWEWEGNSRAELLPGDDAPVSEAVERAEMVKALSSEITRLPEREQLVLALYYQEELTLREISLVLELSESRVCQLHARALRQLREGLRAQL